MLKSTIWKTMLAVVLCLFALPLLAQAAHENDLSWTAGAGGGTVTGFNVKRSSTKGGPYATLQAVPANTLTFADSSSLVEGQHRFYVITATGPGGESANSNEIDLTTPFSSPTAPALTGSAK